MIGARQDRGTGNEKATAINDHRVIGFCLCPTPEWRMLCDVGCAPTCMHPGFRGCMVAALWQCMEPWRGGNADRSLA